MENKENNIDIFELYSFTSYLYLYGIFFLFVFEQPFLKCILINIFCNVFSYYTLNFNILTFLKHNYWRKNLKEVAMPQLISCGTNLTIYSSFKNDNIYISILMNGLLHYLLKQMYKDELRYSKNLRLLIGFIFFIYCHLF